MDNPNHKITFLLADDSLIKQGLVFVLEDIELDCDLIAASNLHQLVEISSENNIDIAIIDAHFPDGKSISILSEIRKNNPKVRILIYSGIDENTQSLKFLNAGANGFLSKLSDEEEIERAIRKMYEEGEYISLTTRNLLMSSERERSLINPLFRLTERELQIAEMYADGLGNLEITNQLDIKQNTVSTLKKRIFDKLNIENVVELSELIKGHH